MKTTLSCLLLSAALATTFATAASLNPLNLFERNVASNKHSNNGLHARNNNNGKPSASPSPPKPTSPTPGPATYSLSIPQDATYLSCPPAGPFQAVYASIFYYPDGKTTTRCTTLAAGGGSSYCDYDGLTGDLVGKSYTDGELADYCKGTKAVVKNGNYECETTCTGPNPFTYAVVDVIETRLICFFDGQNTSGDKLEVGCSYNAQTGEAIGSANAGTVGCDAISAEYGVCAATLA